jgi:hypothetical protein
MRNDHRAMAVVSEPKWSVWVGLNLFCVCEDYSAATAVADEIRGLASGGRPEVAVRRDEPGEIISAAVRRPKA